MSSTLIGRPLNIALVHTADQGGGAEQSTLSLHTALIQLGHNSTMYVGTKRSERTDVHQIKRFRCFPGVLRFARYLEESRGWQYLYHPWFRQLDRLIGANVDLIHFQSLWSGREGYADVGGIPRLTHRFPSLITLRDWWMFTGHCAHPALNCEKWRTGCGACPDLTLAPAIKVDGTRFNWKRKLKAIQKSHLRVTTVSDWLGGLVSESPIFNGKQIHTVHNGIDESMFYPRDRAAMRIKLNLPPEAFVVMITGQSVHGTWSHSAWSAPQYALEACKKSGAPLYLLAVGRTGEELLSKWGGPGKAVSYQSDPNALAELYCASDIVLVASLWETFGRIPAEAQMCGVPVAAFATGGIPEIVEHGVTGFVTERLNTSALGQAIHTLYDQPQLRKQFEAAAAKSALSKFSNLEIAQKYVDLYRLEISARKAGRQTTIN